MPIYILFIRYDVHDDKRFILYVCFIYDPEIVLNLF